MTVIPYYMARRRLLAGAGGGEPGGDIFTLTPTEFFDLDLTNGPGWSTVIYPPAIQHGGKTYISWQTVSASGGPTKAIWSTAFDHAIDRWLGYGRIGQFTITNDTHGGSAMVRDAEGYLYSFFGSHANDQSWSISDSPDDHTSWTQQASLTGPYTYPKPVLVGSTIYLFLRHFPGGTKRTCVMRTATPSSGAATFSSPHTAIVDLGDDSRFYGGEFHAVGTEIHFVAARANFSDSVRRHVYYFVFDTTTGDVSNFDGSTTVAAASLPVDLTAANASFRIFEHASGDEGDVPCLQFDSSGAAHVLFVDGASSPYDLMHMFLDGGSWSTPETVAAGAITDASPSVGYLDVIALVPGADGKMEAWYNVAGDKVRKVRSAAGVWGSAETMVEKDVYNFVSAVAVHNADPELRVVFAESSGSANDTAADFLKRYAHGDKGFVSRPNVAPTAISLSKQTVSELNGVGSQVAALTATDNDYVNEFSFTITADPDAKFAIAGDKLLLAATVTYPATHSVTIQVADAGGLTFEDTFEITVTEAGDEWEIAGVWDHSVDGDSAAAIFTGLAGAGDILVIGRNVTLQSAGSRVAHFSVDNGSSYFSASGDYILLADTGGGTAVTGIFAQSDSTTGARSFAFWIDGASVDGTIKNVTNPNRGSGDTRLFVASGAPINAVRIVGSGGGNLTGGTITVLRKAEG